MLAQITQQRVTTKDWYIQVHILKESSSCTTIFLWKHVLLTIYCWLQGDSMIAIIPFILKSIFYMILSIRFTRKAKHIGVFWHLFSLTDIEWVHSRSTKYPVTNHCFKTHEVFFDNQQQGRSALQPSSTFCSWL